MPRVYRPSEREKWNAKFRAGEAQSAEPDPLVPEVCSVLPPGRALDLAGGAGRHAIWLAQRGWQVVLADISDEALAIAAQRSAEFNIRLALRRESAEETLAWAIQHPQTRYDLILVFWFLAREQFSALPALLSSGGLLVYKTFTSEHPRFAGGESPRYALHPGELRQAFPALETVLYREADGVAEIAASAR